MDKTKIDLNRGYWIALGSAMILSTTAIFIRHLTQAYQMPALVLAVWRDAIVAVTLFLVFRLFNPDRLRVNRQHIPMLVIYGLTLTAFNATWTLSVAINGAAIATVLVYCSAGFTALLGWWFLKERLGWIKLLAVAVCLAGCVFISGALDIDVWSSNGAGILTGVLAGLSYAVYSMMGRSTAQRGLNSWTTLFYTFSIATFFLLVLNLIPGLDLPGAAISPSDLLWLGTSLSGWGILFLLAAGPTVLGFGLYNASLTYLPASVANLIVSIEPVFTALIAYTLLGERLTAAQIFGSVMILTGVLLLRIDESRLTDQSAVAEKKPVSGFSTQQIE